MRDVLPRTPQTSHRHVSNVVIGKPTAFGVSDVLSKTSVIEMKTLAQ